VHQNSYHVGRDHPPPFGKEKYRCKVLVDQLLMIANHLMLLNLPEVPCLDTVFQFEQHHHNLQDGFFLFHFIPSIPSVMYPITSKTVVVILPFVSLILDMYS